MCWTWDVRSVANITGTPKMYHDDVIKWKHFPRYWPFVRRIHRSPVNSLHKDQWRGALMFSLICAWINGWVNDGEAGYLRRHHAHYDASVVTIVTSPYLGGRIFWKYQTITIDCCWCPGSSYHFRVQYPILIIMMALCMATTSLFR